MTTFPTTTMELFTNSSNLTNTTLHVWERYNETALFTRYRPARVAVERYLSPLWYCVGFPGNILAFVVWIQPRMRHSSGCYLAALSMADFIFLILQLLFELQITWGIQLLHFPVLCETFPAIYYVFQYLSPLLVLGFTVERYISICHPFQREKFCTTSRAVKVIVLLLGMSLAMGAVQCYFWTYIPANHEAIPPTESDCSLRESVLLGGTASVFSVWAFVTELLVFGLVPLGILLLNVLVIKETKKMSDNEEKRLCLKKGTKTSGPSATTFMLLAVSFYFIFTTLPVTILYTLATTFPHGELYVTDDQLAVDGTWQRYLTYWTVRGIVQKLCVSHYACNFFIYLLTGTQFRKELRRVACTACFKPKPERPDYMWATEETRLPARTSGPNSQSPAANGTMAHV